MSLRDLDARLVPRLAALLRALLDGAAERRRTAGRALRTRGAALLSGGGALRRLDERYARSGPLGLVREVPQLGVLLVATVFLAGTGAAVALSGPDEAAPGGTAAGPSSGGGQRVLGPVVGADIDAHFATAAALLRDLAEQDPDGSRLALVSLRTGLAPQAATELLREADVELVRAYLRAPVPGVPEEIAFQTTGDVLGDLRTVYASTAERKAMEVGALRETAETIVPSTPAEQEFKAQYEADAATAEAERAAYAADCACVFALVVEADLRVLAGLLDLGVVRGVEVAPAGVAVTAVDLRPLAPSQTGTVLDVPPPPA